MTDEAKIRIFDEVKMVFEIAHEMGLNIFSNSPVILNSV
tara:strand:- start:76881 stop:76997 length:117 start_codon:yes stop_codon:yes gene_type:complete